MLLFAAAAAAAALLFYNLRSGGPEKVAVSAVQKVKGSTIENVEHAADFKELIGRWVRPDGGYVIDIRSAAPGGLLDAGYFNPQPINVHRADATIRDGVPQVFIELRDQGYPGSTYTLLYNREQQALVGTYYQAAMGERFAVIFVRQE